MPPKDPTVRAALQRVEETYLEPDRIDPPAMLAAALRTAAGILPAASVEETEGGFSLQFDGGALDLAAPGEGRLAEVLSPGLERVLALLEERRGAGQPDLPEVSRMRAALLHGALRTLDRFSGAYTGGSRSNLIGNFTGTSVGVGVMIGRREEVIRVIEVYPGSGAATAGLHAGDILTRVDETAVDGLVVSGVSRLLRGDEATQVRVFVERAGVPLAFTVTRRQYVKPSVTSRVEDSIGVLRISHLSKNTPAQVIEHLERLAGEDRVRMILMDLRGKQRRQHAGGCSRRGFVPRGGCSSGGARSIGQARSGTAASRGCDKTWLAAHAPAILMDGRTGSSAELLAAALGWHDRALLIGNRTYGKNIVQKLHNFEADDLSVKISSAYMKTAGRRLPGDGLPPDIWVGSGSDAGEAPVDGMGIRMEPGQEDDPWAAMALRLLAAHGGPSRDAMVKAVRDQS